MVTTMTHRQVRRAHDDVEDSVECSVDWQSVTAQAHHAEPRFLHKGRDSDQALKLQFAIQTLTPAGGGRYKH